MQEKILQMYMSHKAFSMFFPGHIFQGQNSLLCVLLKGFLYFRKLQKQEKKLKTAKSCSNSQSTLKERAGVIPSRETVP
jgi:hypothetical protein